MISLVKQVWFLWSCAWGYGVKIEGWGLMIVEYNLQAEDVKSNFSFSFHPMWCRWLSYLPFTQDTRVRVPASEWFYSTRYLLCVFILILHYICSYSYPPPSNLRTLIYPFSTHLLRDVRLSTNLRLFRSSRNHHNPFSCVPYPTYFTSVQIIFFTIREPVLEELVVEEAFRTTSILSMEDLFC